MKILIDPQVFNFQTYGGISRYYTEILSRIKLNSKDVLINPIYNTRNIYFNESYLVDFRHLLYRASYRVLKSVGVSLRNYYDKKNISNTKKILRDGAFDVFVATYYNPYFLEHIGNKPYVLTVYDMIHELYPEYFKDDAFNVVINKEIVLKRASKIIAVSKNTKKDILRFYPEIDETKIEVIYHGQSIKKTDFNQPEINLPERYILYIGSRATYKNFDFFIKSITPTLINDTSINVLFGGAGSFSKEEELDFEMLGIRNQTFQYDFQEKELGMLYKSALCFVFPSKYEGFGIPVLESMYSGCPVVLTNYSSFPEVAGDAGVYFEKDNEIDLREKIELLINSPLEREKYIDLGYQRIKLFDWDTAAKKCSKLYKSVLNDSK